MFNQFKRKKKFDKSSRLGIVFSIVAAAGMIYEIITAENIRTWLVLGYAFVIACGGLYIFFLEDQQ
ncbi:hypothetical protein JW960_07500 [candidate division KSB1 bacterium]|nr:hypothetical protein [candidate division KSB1 bacterium]